MAIDPVCKMTVDEATAAATSEYQGKTYYFCAPGCKTAFDEEPQRYLAKPEASVTKTLLQRLNPFKHN